MEGVDVLWITYDTKINYHVDAQRAEHPTKYLYCSRFIIGRLLSILLSATEVPWEILMNDSSKILMNDSNKLPENQYYVIGILYNKLELELENSLFDNKYYIKHCT